LTKEQSVSASDLLGAFVADIVPRLKGYVHSQNQESSMTLFTFRDASYGIPNKGRHVLAMRRTCRMAVDLAAFSASPTKETASSHKFPGAGRARWHLNSEATVSPHCASDKPSKPGQHATVTPSSPMLQ
jgi:hypothetical protein